MRKYGFKLFSTNLQNNPAFVDEAAAFVRANNREMFIELMVVPTTPAEDWDVFRDKFAGLEVTIHAPHNTMNFDTGYPERFESNAKILDAARRRGTCQSGRNGASVSFVRRSADCDRKPAL